MIIRNNYMSKLNENKRVISQNQARLVKLKELEKQLTERIASNMTKQAAVVALSHGSKPNSAYMLQSTTNHTSHVGSRSRFNSSKDQNSTTPMRARMLNPIQQRKGIPSGKQLGFGGQKRSMITSAATGSVKALKQHRQQRPSSTVPHGKRDSASNGDASLPYHHTSARSREPSAEKDGANAAKIVDVTLLPKRPMTTANPNQRPETDPTYGAGQSSIQNPSQDANLIKEDDPNEDEEYLYGHEDQTKAEKMNTVSAAEETENGDSPQRAYAGDPSNTA